MSLYYEDESIRLYHGDCLTETAWLKADVLVTDPPYGIGSGLSSGGKKSDRHYGKQTATHSRKVAWDKSLDVRNAALALWGDRPAAVFGTARRLDDLPAFREVPLVWDKGELVGMGDTTFPWRPLYELIYVSGGGWAGKRTSAILRHQLSNTAARDIGHPTPKPVGLMSELIHKAPPGVIADPFAGSGSTLISASLLGRKAIGIELEERYCEVIAKRLAQGVLDFGEGA